MMGSSATVRPPFMPKFRALRDLLVECGFVMAFLLVIPPSTITMNAAESTCLACHKVFTHTGLTQHLAKTHRPGCCAVYAASQPQSLHGSSPFAQTLLTLTANSTLAHYPGLSFGSGHPSGHNRTSSDLPAFSSLGVESTMTGNMDDCKVTFY